MIRLPDVKSDPDRTWLFAVGQHWVRLRFDRSLGGPWPRQRDGGTMALARACCHDEATREITAEKRTESRFVIVDSFWYQLLDHDSDVSESVMEQRVKELLPHHAGLSDCRVLAETESMELGYLITRDDKLQRRLQAHTKVRIVRPTELWASLGIDCAPRTQWSRRRTIR
jgi:hypothetical protein